MFGRKLCEEILATEIRIEQLANGQPPKPRRRRYRELDDRLRRVMNSYESNARTLEEYIDSVGHLLHI